MLTRLARNTIPLSGSLANGEVFVVGHNDISDKSQVDLLVGNLQHNGNDSIVLYKGDQVIDSIGKISENVNWSSNGVTTKDRTLVRLSTISSGDTDPNDAFDPSLEWQVFPKDTLSNLGSHTFEGTGDSGGAVTMVAETTVAALAVVTLLNVALSLPRFQLFKAMAQARLSMVTLYGLKVLSH